MEDIVNQEQSAFVNDDELYNKKTQAIPKPERNIGIDTKGVFVDDFIYAGESSQLDISKIESFTQLSQNREQLYTALDSMADDSTIAAVIETYAEDATETNDSGQIVWAESDDEDASKYVNFLLESLNVNRNVYKWTHSLCKYGDLYLRLYRKSEFEDSLFDKEDKQEKESLNEDVKLKLYAKNDNYAHYIEAVPNPAEIFELTKFGKSYAYIKATSTSMAKKNDSVNMANFRYSFKKKDVEVYPATEFVHACLDDNSSRIPEEVKIYMNDDDFDKDENALSYTVKRGQSLLYSAFKSWREMMLLQNALLLNRLTKSAVTRVVQVEVGDMPKEDVQRQMYAIKGLLEQKSTIETGSAMTEYTNPGPMENTVYVPTRNQQGTLTVQTIGGDPDVKGIADIDYFEDNMFGALRVPKQYFGRTDDNAGFSGGQSLSIISSRYAKAIKRIQNAIVQALTDAINLMLIDKGLTKYVGKFELHMLPPTTAEENDRRDLMQGKIGNARDILDMLGDIQDPEARLRIAKILTSGVTNEPEILTIIQEEIDKLEESGEEIPVEDDSPTSLEPRMGGGLRMNKSINPDEGDIEGEEETPSEEPGEGEETIDRLPSPAELNAGDMTEIQDNEEEA